MLGSCVWIWQRISCFLNNFKGTNHASGSLPKRQFGVYKGKGSFELMDDFAITEKELIA